MLSKLDVALCGSKRLGPTEYMYRNVASRSYSDASGIESPLGSAVPGVVSPETSVPPVVPAAGVVPAVVPAVAAGAFVPDGVVAVDPLDESSSSPPHAVITTPAASASAVRRLNRCIGSPSVCGRRPPGGDRAPSQEGDHTRPGPSTSHGHARRRCHAVPPR